MIPLLKAFNDQFGNIDWKNNDKNTARIEHDAALQRVMIDLLADHTELFKQFSDNQSFKKWLGDTIFGVTYQQQAGQFLLTLSGSCS